jgi:hypothetical protein
LYVNNKKVADVGNFSSNETFAETRLQASSCFYNPSSDTLDIYFEVSNYFYRGGINYSVKFWEMVK